MAVERIHSALVAFSAQVAAPEDMPKQGGNFCFFGSDGAYVNGVLLAAIAWVALSALDFPGGQAPKVAGTRIGATANAGVCVRARARAGVCVCVCGKFLNCLLNVARKMADWLRAEVVVESLSVIQATLSSMARKATGQALQPNKANADRLTDVFRCSAASVDNRPFRCCCCWAKECF